MPVTSCKCTPHPVSYLEFKEINNLYYLGFYSVLSVQTSDLEAFTVSFYLDGRFFFLSTPLIQLFLAFFRNSMGGSPEWDNRMMDSLKNFDISSPEVKEQFGKFTLFKLKENILYYLYVYIWILIY